MRKYTPLRHAGSVLWKRRPVHLTFFLTARCNARCPFCFYRAEKDKDHADELSLEEIRRVSSSMGSLLWLAFSGGEIFLRDDLFEITKVFYENNRPAIILLPTNGMLPEAIESQTRDILRHCEKSVVVMKLSIDSAEESLHDRLRGVKGSFGKVMETYERVGRFLDKYPNFELGVNSVFCSMNESHMEELLRFVNRLDRIRTHTVSLVRGDVPEIVKKIDMEKYRDVSRRLESNLVGKLSAIYRFRGSRLKAAQDILQRRLIYRTAVENRKLIGCHAGRLNLVINERGELFPCELFTRSMGNLRQFDYDVKKALEGKEALDVVRAIRENGCFCTHECNMMTNILFSPRMYPALLRQYLRLL